jgi:hypothetical protein
MKRISFGLTTAILASCVAAASQDSANSAGLSKLDFMVIASMADSPHLLTAGYKLQKNPCASTK